MKLDIFSLLIRGAVGGVWGLAAVILAYMSSAWLPAFTFLFYPFILAGAVPAAVLFSGKKVSVSRAIFVGFITGLIYGLVSPIFPLIASILAGASLGGGLSHGTEKPGESLELILSTLKGAVVLPLIILTGSIGSALLDVLTHAPLYHWLFWGAWATLCIRFITGPGKDEPEKTCLPGKSALDDFRTEAAGLTREISELNIKIGI